MPCPPEFISAVRSALAHLHDPAYLESHPLAELLGFVAQAPEMTRGNLLRRTLRLSIEALDPGAGVPPRSPETRPYHILRGRYILNETIEEVGLQLGIGRRQAFRELQRAIEALAQMLWDSCPAGNEPEGAVSPPSARLRTEVERLVPASRQDVELSELVKGAVTIAGRLAEERGIEIQFSQQSSNLHIGMNRVMLRQAILNLLSHAVRTHQDSHLAVRLYRTGNQAVFQFTYRPDTTADEAQQCQGQPLIVATHLLESLGVRWSHESTDDGRTCTSLYIPLAEERRLLVVDDNESLIRLFERYLDGQPYRVFSATNAVRALEMLPQVEPQVIILDVMMPERDGWEALEILRQSEAGRRARILVCSIINDQPLATAMGADGFLHKPVDRAGLLQALEKVMPGT